MNTQKYIGNDPNSENYSYVITEHQKRTSLDFSKKILFHIDEMIFGDCVISNFVENNPLFSCFDGESKYSQNLAEELCWRIRIDFIRTKEFEELQDSEVEKLDEMIYRFATKNIKKHAKEILEREIALLK